MLWFGFTDVVNCSVAVVCAWLSVWIVQIVGDVCCCWFAVWQLVTCVGFWHCWFSRWLLVFVAAVFLGLWLVGVFVAVFGLTVGLRG